MSPTLKAYVSAGGELMLMRGRIRRLWGGSCATLRRKVMWLHLDSKSLLYLLIFWGSAEFNEKLFLNLSSIFGGQHLRLVLLTLISNPFFLVYVYFTDWKTKIPYPTSLEAKGGIWQNSGQGDKSYFFLPWMDKMAVGVAAILWPWGRGQENHRDVGPDTVEPLNQC